MTDRAYLDWNATAPLRPEARAAMLAAMDVVGNPSSVHAEGRKARGLIETARAQVAQALGAEPHEVIFTSGATEAAAQALKGRDLVGAAVEHPCVAEWIDLRLPVGVAGDVHVEAPQSSVLQVANSETGIVQDLPNGLACIDAVQGIGKIPFAFRWSEAEACLVSAHKIGGPKGIGALILRDGQECPPLLCGGGQETGRRAGTENIVGIAGFGAACSACMTDLGNGLWDEVCALRDRMETILANEAPDIICIGKDVARLPNTSCFAIPGWKGETQVMQMDLAGYAISAGSACSSGKVKESRVLRAMGFDSETASSAIRVSLGPTTTEDEITGFARTWIAHYRRFKQRAA